MAQYYNLVADNGVPIMVENVQQICTVDGQSYQLVVQDLNNSVNGTHLVAYSTQQNSEATVFQHQALVEGQLQQASIDQRQNVYIIQTDDLNLSQDGIKTELIQQDHSNQILTVSDGNFKQSLGSVVEGRQIQWINMPENNTKNQTTTMRNSAQRAHVQRSQSHLAVSEDQGTSEKKVRSTPKLKPKPAAPTQSSGANNFTTNNRNTSQPFRLKTAGPKMSPQRPSTPSARSPIRPDTTSNRQAAAQSMGFLSERIKNARMENVRPHQNSPILSGTLQKGSSYVQRSVSPACVGMFSEKVLRVEKSNNDQQVPVSPEILLNLENSPTDSETGNNTASFAYLQKVIDNPQHTIVQQQIDGNTVKMLVVPLKKEQRLITFDIPNEECTVHDLLEQAGIPFNEDTVVSLVKDPILNINYIVETEGGMIVDSTDCADSPDEYSGDQNQLTADGHLLRDDDSSNSSMANNEEPRYVDGKLALCPNCGIFSMDFNRCCSCGKKMPEEVKTTSMNSTNQQRKDTMARIESFYRKNFENANKLGGKRILENSVVKKPRNRPKPKSKPIKEPECLTLSSDEEDDDDSQKINKHDSKNFLSTPKRSNSNPDEFDMISEKEPIITNNPNSAEVSRASGAEANLLKPVESIGDGALQKPHTVLCCRTVRIGSYKYVPKERVMINQLGLLLSVPLLEDETTFVKINVKLQDIVKVLIHFGKAMPVLFFYTNITTGAMIREVLGMQDTKGPYFDPAGKDHTHRRITLLPEKLTEDSKLVLKHLLEPRKLLEELNTKEANDILIRASPKDPPQTPTASRRQSHQTGAANQPIANGTVEKMAVYPPPPAKGGIAINTEDYACLGEDQFLNDVIIDFYLKFLTLEVLSKEDHQRTHVFSSYFYKRLTSPHASVGDSSMLLTPAAKRHARVQKWTKNVNIFEKDFIIIPINEHAHWFLAIICFPGLVGVVSPPTPPPNDQKVVSKTKKVKEHKLQSMTIGSTTITPVTTTITLDQMDDGSERDEAEGDEDELDNESDDEDETDSPRTGETEDKYRVDKDIDGQIDEDASNPVKIPCILIFDSLAGAGRSRVVATLRDYLSCEYAAKLGSEKIFSKDTIKGACPKVPQQSNFTDCGLYVLQYVESFFKDPIKNYTLPIKTLKNWFEEIVVTRKREELSKLLVKLMRQTIGDKSINVPIVQFPTMDGKLKPRLEKVEEKKEFEGKKKDEDVKGNVAQIMEPLEPGEIPRTSTTVYTIVPCQSRNANTDGNSLEMMVDVKPKVHNSNNMLAILRNKRIPRLMLNESEAVDTPAKKHKGET